MQPRQPRGWYLAREAGLLAGVSGDTIGQWARYGYIKSSWSATVPRVYSCQDVAEAIAVHELIDRGVKHGDIRSAIEDLRAEYGDWPLQIAPIATAGGRVVRKTTSGEGWAVGRQRGQGILSFIELQEINRWLRSGGWAVRGADDITHIEVDPDRLSGTPTIRDRRLSAEKVALIAALPDGRRVLRIEYDLRSIEISDAVRWYSRVQQFERAA